LTTFPNIGLNDLGVDIGPDPNAPQFGIENNYQIVDNMTWTTGQPFVQVWRRLPRSHFATELLAARPR
jgi:hypothetical protein